MKKRVISFIMIMALLLMSLNTATATATTNLFVGTVNNVERRIYIDTRIQLKVGKKVKSIGNPSEQVIFDKYGAVWKIVPDGNDTLMWHSPEVMSASSFDFGLDFFFLGYGAQVKEFIVEGEGTKAVGVGYKTHDGTTHMFPSFEEMCDMMNVPEGSIPEPSYIPSTSTSTEPVKSEEMSIKKDGKKALIYQGNTLIGKITLKNSVLTWNRGVEKKVYKKVKKFCFINKSKNFVYETKKGAVFIVSIKTGKKEKMIDKGGKIVVANDYAVKIKTPKKDIDIRNK